MPAPSWPWRGSKEAWATFAQLERNGVSVEHYTLSIMMKAVKTVEHEQDVAKTLALLACSGVDVCSGEILLISVLGLCMRYGHCRVEGILDSFSKSCLRPSVPACGSVIKACSIVKQPPRCRNFFTTEGQRTYLFTIG